MFLTKCYKERCEIMTTIFNKKESIKLIEEYYKRLEGRTVKADIKTQKALIGIYEQQGVMTTVSITEEMEIAGIKKTVSIDLTEEELRNNLAALFGLYGFQLKDMSLQDSLTSTGYGVDESLDAIFNGIKVELGKTVEKGKKKTI